MKLLSSLILVVTVQAHAGAMFDFYDGLTLPRLEHIKMTPKESIAKIREEDRNKRSYEFFQVSPRVQAISDEKAQVVRHYLMSINNKIRPGESLATRLSPEQVAYVTDDMLNAAQILLAYQGVSFELVVQKSLDTPQERRMILISRQGTAELNDIARDAWRNKKGVVLFDPLFVLENGNVLDLSVEKASAPAKRIGMMPLPASPWNQSARMSLESFLSFTQFKGARTFADTELRVAMNFYHRDLTPPAKPGDKEAIPRGHELTLFMSQMNPQSEDFRYSSAWDKFFDFRQLEMPPQVLLSRAAVLTLRPVAVAAEQGAASPKLQLPQLRNGEQAELEKLDSYAQKWMSDLSNAAYWIDLMLVKDYGTHEDDAPYAWVDQNNERWIRFAKELTIGGKTHKFLFRMHLFADAFKKQRLDRVSQSDLRKQIRFQLLLAKELLEDYSTQARHLQGLLSKESRVDLDLHTVAKEILQYLRANSIEPRGSYSTNPLPPSCQIFM